MATKSKLAVSRAQLSRINPDDSENAIRLKRNNQYGAVRARIKSKLKYDTITLITAMPQETKMLCLLGN